MTEKDCELLNYVTGILVGLADKYGVIDVTLYYNSFRVRIERVKSGQVVSNDVGVDGGEAQHDADPHQRIT